MKSKWTTLTYLIIASVFANAQSTQGPNNPSAVVEDGSVGVLSWASAANVVSSNNSHAYASAVIGLIGVETKMMKVSGFNFNIPVASAIDGITVEIERKASGFLYNVKDEKVYLLKEANTTGVNRAKTGVKWSSSDGVASYGGANDLWGATWTVANINSSKFGVGLTVDVDGFANLLPKASVDNIRITVHYSSTLPIELVSQDVVALETVNEIKWETATEINNLGFYIERLNDQQQWEVMGFVDGAGTSNSTQIYKYHDVEIQGKQEFTYRIKQVDENGTETVFDILRVERPLEQPTEAIRLYPNPSVSYFYKSISMSESDIVVRSMDGKEVIREHFVNYGTPCRINHHLPKGMYVIEEVALGYVDRPEILYVSE